VKFPVTWISSWSGSSFVSQGFGEETGSQV